MTEPAVEGYLSSMLVYGAAMRRVDAVAVPVDPLHQPVVPGPPDRVQPRRKARLRKKQWTLETQQGRKTHRKSVAAMWGSQRPVQQGSPLEARSGLLLLKAQNKWRNHEPDFTALYRRPHIKGQYYFECFSREPKETNAAFHFQSHFHE